MTQMQREQADSQCPWCPSGKQPPPLPPVVCSPRIPIAHKATTSSLRTACVTRKSDRIRQSALSILRWLKSLPPDYSVHLLTLQRVVRGHLARRAIQRRSLLRSLGLAIVVMWPDLASRCCTVLTVGCRGFALVPPTVA